MVSIKDRKILRQMFSHYDYVMTTAQLSKEKLYYRDIQRMLKAGLIEKVKRGYYHWTMGSGKGDVVIILSLVAKNLLQISPIVSPFLPTARSELKSFSLGIVTISPPAMSSASLTISYGNLVTFCLQTFASSKSMIYPPDLVA